MLLPHCAVTRVPTQVFDQALEGGGAKNINFQELAADLAQITFDYPFRIPPYFALIIRAIGGCAATAGRRVEARRLRLWVLRLRLHMGLVRATRIIRWCTSASH